MLTERLAGKEMTALASNSVMLAAADLQSQGDHYGAGRIMLLNIGIADRKRPLWLLLAACQFFMADDVKRAKRVLGRVDPRGLEPDDRRQFMQVMNRTDDILAERRHQLKMARSEKPVKVPTFLKV